MATVIASSVGASMTAATGRPNQGHLVYGTNNQQWYLFYLTGTQVLSLAYSKSMTGSWTVSSAPFTLSAVHNSEGRNFGFAYDSIAGNDIVHMNSTYFVTTASVQTRHTRFQLDSGVNPLTGWTTTNAETQLSSRSVSAAGNPSGATVILDSGNNVYDCSSYINSTTSLGDQRFFRNPTTDTSASWTPGTWSQTVAYNPTTFVTSNAFTQTDNNNGWVLNLCDNASTAGSYTAILWSKWTSSWSASAAATATVTAAGTNQWGVVARNATLGAVDVHLVCLSNASNAFSHRRYNGTSWVAGATIPALTVATNSGLFLTTNGTDVWLFAIDSTFAVQWLKWSSGSSTWGSWAVLESTSASARTYLTGCQTPGGNAFGLIWTQVNGANIDIVGSQLGLPTTIALGVATVASSAPAVTGGFAGNGATIGVSTSAASAPDLTAAPGTFATSITVSSVTASAPALTANVTGGATFSLGVSSVVSSAPALTTVLGGLSASIATASVTVSAPALTAIGTGEIAFSLTTSAISVSAPVLTAIATGGVSATLAVGTVSSLVLDLGSGASGGVSQSLGISPVTASAPALTGTVAPLNPALSVASVIVTAPLLTANVTGGVISSLAAASIVCAAPTITSGVTGGVTSILGVSTVLVSAPALSGIGTGSISQSLGTSTSSASAPAPSGLPTGSAVQSLGVSSVSADSPSLTALPTGGVASSLGIASVLAGAPSVVGLVPGQAVIFAAGVTASAPILTAGGTGGISAALTTASVIVSAPALITSVSLGPVITLGVSGVTVSAPTMTAGVSGGVSRAIGVCNVIASAPPVIRVIANIQVSVGVANISAGSLDLGDFASGIATRPLGLAAVISSASISTGPGLASNIFSIFPQMTTLLN